MKQNASILLVLLASLVIPPEKESEDKNMDQSTVRLTYQSLPPRVKQIANNALGIGVLHSIFRYSTTYNMTLKMSDGEIVGFAIYHFQKSALKGGGSLLTGVIDCVVVDAVHRLNGYGSSLTYNVLTKMASSGVDRIEFMMKTPPAIDPEFSPGLPLTGSETALMSMGFRKVKEYPEHFVEQSRRSGYDCQFCQERPCRCTGVLFSMDDRSR